MTEREVTILNESLERCIADEKFFDRFYLRFLGKSPDVAEKFRNTDFPHQKLALKASLYVIFAAAGYRRPDFRSLNRIAVRHSRSDADIPPYMYNLWLDALLHTVSEADRRFNQETEGVWRKALEPAIHYMVSYY